MKSPNLLRSIFIRTNQTRKNKPVYPNGQRKDSIRDGGIRDRDPEKRIIANRMRRICDFRWFDWFLIVLGRGEATHALLKF